MGGIMLKSEEEVLYMGKSLCNNKPRGYKNSNKGRSHQEIAQLGWTQKNDKKTS